MKEYTHVRAKTDVYDNRGDIICFAGDVYPITFIDIENGLYHINCEPEIGGYIRAMAFKPYDPDFYFIEAEMIEEIIEEEYYEEDDIHED